jgi:hypothetical protein
MGSKKVAIPDYSSTYGTIGQELTPGQRLELWQGSLGVWKTGTYLGSGIFRYDDPSFFILKLKKDTRIRLEGVKEIKEQ